MKDRGDGGSSPSIPAGNNGAAGQECCLREEGKGHRGGAGFNADTVELSQRFKSGRTQGIFSFFYSSG